MVRQTGVVAADTGLHGHTALPVTASGHTHSHAHVNTKESNDLNVM